MARLVKILYFASFSSVYLMQAPCTRTNGGFSMFPNLGTAIPNPLAGLGL